VSVSGSSGAARRGAPEMAPRRGSRASPRVAALSSSSSLSSSGKKRSRECDDWSDSESLGTSSAQSPASSDTPSGTWRACPVPRLSSGSSQGSSQGPACAARGSGGLIGREAEVRRIQSFLDEHVSGGVGGSLYVCGGPGTGKTASVTHCLEVLSKRVGLRASGKGGKVVPVKMCTLNGNTLHPAAAVYPALEEALTGSRSVNAEAARRAVERALSRPRPTLLVAFVDEVDQLLGAGANKDEVLYQLFEWAHRPGSRLCLLGVANAVDLHERFLPKLGPRRAEDTLVFSAYDKEQLKAILAHKVADEAAAQGVRFDAVALELCAGKIAAKSGDLRKGLGVCARAVLAAKQGQRAQLEARAARGEPSPPPAQAQAQAQAQAVVSVAMMVGIMRGLFESPYVETIRALPQQAQYALAALVRLDAAQGADSLAETRRAASVEAAFAAYRRMADEWNLPALSLGDFSADVLPQLAEESLVELGPSSKKSPRDRTVRLCPRVSDVQHAFDDNAALRQLLSGARNRQFGANIYAVPGK
jgi:Cdc6-like AAA superfamily ATPase